MKNSSLRIYSSRVSELKYPINPTVLLQDHQNLTYTHVTSLVKGSKQSYLRAIYINKLNKFRDWNHPT